MKKLVMLICAFATVGSGSAYAALQCGEGPKTSGATEITLDTASVAANSDSAFLRLRSGGETFFQGVWNYSKNQSILDPSSTTVKSATFFKDSVLLGIIDHSASTATVSLWNLEKSRPIFTQEWPYTHWSQPHPVNIDLSTNKERLAILVTGQGYQKLQIFEVSSNGKKTEFDFGGDVLSSFKFESDSSLLITAVNEQSNSPAEWSTKVMRLDILTGVLETIFEEKDRSSDLQIKGLSSSRLIASEPGSYSGRENLVIFDISSTPAKKLVTIHDTAVFAAEQNTIVAASHRLDYAQDGNVRILDFDGKEHSDKKFQSVIEAAAIEGRGDSPRIKLLNEKAQLCTFTEKHN